MFSESRDVQISYFFIRSIKPKFVSEEVEEWSLVWWVAMVLTTSRVTGVDVFEPLSKNADFDGGTS